MHKRIVIVALVALGIGAIAATSAFASPARPLGLTKGRAAARQYLGRFLATTGDTGSLTSCYHSSSTRVVCGAKTFPSSDITCSAQVGKPSTTVIDSNVIPSL